MNPLEQELNRRQFFAASGMAGVLGASKSLFPSWMPRLAFRSQESLAQSSASGAGDVLIHIFLRGGMDGLSAVVPYGEGNNYYSVRPTIAVPEPGQQNGAVDLNGFFGLHPTLAALKEVYDDGVLAVVHATGCTDPTRSHFDAMAFIEAGTPGSKSTPTGWIGRHLQSAAWQNESPFRAVGMGAIVPQSLRGPVAPLSLRSIGDFHFKGRQDELLRQQQALASLYTVSAPSDRLGQQAKLVFETVDQLAKLDVNHYQPSGGALYPDDEFGIGLRQVAQLIKAEVGLEVACVDLGGWDTHEAQGTLNGQFNGLLTSLGKGLSALYADLGDHMQRVSVVVMSEFGRRAYENGSAGTDHGHGNAMLLMGGGINGGQVYGDWPTLAADRLDEGDLAVTTDYRDVVAEIVRYRLNNPALDQVFPNHSVKELGLVKR